MPQPVKTTIGDLFIDSGTNQEVDPILFARADGRFRAGWMDNAGSAEYDVWSNLYTASGGWIATDFIKNTTTSIESHIGIGGLANGTQAFAWTSSTGGNADIFAEIRDINGTVLAPAFQINTGGSFATGNQDRPEVVGLDTGNFAFVWIDRNAGHITFAIHNTSGGQVLAPTVLSQTATTQNFGSPPTTVRFDTALLQNGNFAVAYTNNALDAVFRIVSPTGSFITGEIGIDSNPTKDNVGASVATLADGRLVVVTFDVSDPMVRGQIFNEDGTTSVALFDIGTSPNIGRPQVAALHDGRFMVVWNDSGDISGRVMFANGTPDGDEFTVNSVTANTQERPTITVLADGRVVVGWHSDENSSGVRDVKMTIYDPRESALNKTGTALAEDWYGTSFNDVVSMGDGLDLFHGGGGNDVASGENGNDELIGENGNDTLTGNAGNDFLDGNDGDDVLNGGADADEMRGGDGIDTVSYAGSSLAVTVNLASQTASGGDAQGDVISEFENAAGGFGADTLTGDGNANILDGGAGDDTMSGGAGNDTYFVDAAGDVVAEATGGGYDTVNTTRLTYLLGPNVERVNFVGVGNFVGTGNALANRFQGGNNDDRFIDIAGGADIFSGGIGNDTVDFRTSVTGAVIDFVSNVHGGAAVGDSYSGIEKFLGSNTASDTMSMGGTGRALFVGGGGGDTLTGGVKNDQLIGQGGNDTLSGGADRDSLDGGTGNDTMTGGAAGDVFVFIDAVFGQDTITDYQDGIDSFKVFSAAAGDIADFAIANNGSTSVTLTLNADPTNTITINGAAPITITAADFIFY